MALFNRKAVLLLLIQLGGYVFAQGSASFGLESPLQEANPADSKKGQDTKTKSLEDSNVSGAHLWQNPSEARETHVVGNPQNMREGWSYEYAKNPAGRNPEYNLHGVPHAQAAVRFDSAVKPYSTYQTWSTTNVKSDLINYAAARNNPEFAPQMPAPPADSLAATTLGQAQPAARQMAFQTDSLQQQLDAINNANPSSMDVARQMPMATPQEPTTPTGNTKPSYTESIDAARQMPMVTPQVSANLAGSFYSQGPTVQTFDYRSAPGTPLIPEYRTCSSLLGSQNQQVQSGLEYTARQMMPGIDQNPSQSWQEPQQNPLSSAYEQRQSMPMLIPNQQFSTFAAQVPMAPQVSQMDQQQRQPQQPMIASNPQQQQMPSFSFSPQMQQAPIQQQQRQNPMFAPEQQATFASGQQQMFAPNQQPMLIPGQQQTIDPQQQNRQPQQQPMLNPEQQPMLNPEQQPSLNLGQQMSAFNQRQMFGIQQQQQELQQPQQQQSFLPQQPQSPWEQQQSQQPGFQRQPQQQQTFLPQQPKPLWEQDQSQQPGFQRQPTQQQPQQQQPFLPQQQQSSMSSWEQQMPQQPSTGFERQMSQQQQPTQMQSDLQTSSLQPQMRSEDSNMQTVAASDGSVKAEDQAKLDEMRAALEEMPEARHHHHKKIVPNIYINVAPQPSYGYSAPSYAVAYKPSYGAYGAYAGGYAKSPVAYAGYRDSVGASSEDTKDESKEKTTTDSTDVTSDDASGPKKTTKATNSRK